MGNFYRNCIVLGRYTRTGFLASDTKDWSIVFKNAIGNLLTFAAIIAVVGYVTWLAAK
jgi:hypothetical protein